MGCRELETTSDLRFIEPVEKSHSRMRKSNRPGKAAYLYRLVGIKVGQASRLSSTKLTYSKTGQLLSIEKSSTTDITNGTNNTNNTNKIVFQYGFDSIGNRLSYATALTKETYDYNKLNQILNDPYKYDAFGNLTSTPDASYKYNVDIISDEKYYYIDVLANKPTSGVSFSTDGVDADAESDKMTIVLPKTSTRGARLRVDRTTNTVKYIRVKNELCAFTDSFEYSLKDAEGNESAKVTVNITAHLK